MDSREREQGVGRPKRRPYIARMWLVLLAMAVFSSTLPKAAGVPVHSSEVPILQSIQQAWTKTFDGWSGVGDCDRTSTLSCNSEGRVVAILLNSSLLSGSIPDAISTLTNLRTLDLSDNDLSGSIPVSISALTNLQTLKLGSNKLDGSIPASISALKKLQKLDLYINQLTGNIPDSIGALTSLLSLDMSGNQLLTGSIPTSIGALTNLQGIYLQTNNLTGSIPDTISALRNLQSLLFNGNQLTGSIPDTIGALTNLQSLKLSYNKLTGSIPDTIGALGHLQTLNLHYNHLNGSIPSSIGALINLQYLDLHNNSLTGSIPDAIGTLSNLQKLSIGNNQLTGILPTTLVALRALTNLDVLVNCPANNAPCPGMPPLEKRGMFCNTTCVDFCNNCDQAPKPPPPPVPSRRPPPPGELLDPSVNTVSTPPPSNGTNNSETTSPSSNVTNDSAISTGVLVGIVCAAVGTVTLTSLLVLCICKQRRNHKCDVEVGSTVHENGADSEQARQPVQQDNGALVAQQLRIMTLTELRNATKSFSKKQFIGEGGSSLVYRGDAPNGQQWAVKRYRESGSRADHAFLQEVSNLSRLQNPHLVRVLGCCMEKNERIVVYEFMKNGSLRDAFKRNPPLSFEERLTIACSVAQGLRHLHDQKPSIIHRDIKPDNILLGAQWEAKVGDFGLLRTLDEQKSTYTQCAGTPGYVDPEYARRSKLTTKSDVYSFGIVILEMFTGRNVCGERQDVLQHAGESQPGQRPVPSDIRSITGSPPDVQSSSHVHGQPLRETLISIRKQRYRRPGWLSDAFRYSNLPQSLEYLPVNVKEGVLQIGIDCSAPEPSSRPDIRRVEEDLLKLAGAWELWSTEMRAV